MCLRLTVSPLLPFHLTSSWLPSSPQRSGSAEYQNALYVTHCPHELGNAQNIRRSVAPTCSLCRPPGVPTFASSDMGGQRTKISSHMLTSLSLVGSGTTTPRRDTSKQGVAKRKQTLLNLLDALNELTNDEDAFPKGEPRTCPVLAPRLMYWLC